ncbi:MAG: DUF2079 domain-containing protein [Spirulinaceae cyanobacterium]
MRISKYLKDFPKSVAIAAGIFFALTTAFLLHRYYSGYFNYTNYDQSIFTQLFWNGTHGKMFQSSLSSSLSAAVELDGELPKVFYYRLGQHFTPALLVWLPLYFLYPSAATLMVLQAAIMTAGGIVLYFLARHYLDEQKSIFIALSFYCANAVIGPTLANFSDFCQIPLYVFSLLLALEKRYWWLFVGLSALLLSVREDSGIILFSFGFYFLLSRRYPKIGLALCIFSFGYILLVTNVIMPSFSEDISRRFMMEQFAGYVDGEEASTLEVIGGILSKPQLLFQELFSPLPQLLRYLSGHWLPLAYIPAISPAAWLTTAFPLLTQLLRQDMWAFSINMRFVLAVVPGIFYGAIIWWSNHPGALKLRFRRIWILCLSLSLFFTFTSNPHRAWSFIIPDSVDPLVYVSLPQQWRHMGHLNSLQKQIPPDASVAATTQILPHLATRRQLLPFPRLQLINDAKETVDVDYGIADLWQFQQYQAAFDDNRLKLQELVPIIEQILVEGNYGLIGYEDGVILLQKGVSSEVEALAGWQGFLQDLAG